MTKPITGLTVFGSNTSGTTTQLDNNFSALQNAINDLNSYSNFLTDTGSANSIVVTLAANLTGALTNGLMIQVKVAATNTGSTTLNYNSGGALNVLNQDGSSLLANQLISTGIYQFIYRASDTSWLLMGAAGAGLVPIASVDANNNDTIYFNNVLTSAYKSYKLILSNILACSNGATMRMAFGNGNGPTFLAGTNYAYAFDVRTPSGIQNIAHNGTSTFFLVQAAGVMGNSALYTYAAEIDIFAPSANGSCKITVQSGYLTSSGNLFTTVVGAGMMNVVTPITSINFNLGTGNFNSGTIALYGVK